VKFRHLFEWLAARAALMVFGFLPLSLSCRVGAAAGWVAFRLDRKHRRLALWNLSQSSANAGPAGNREIVRKLYRHLGMSAAEFAHQSRLTRETLGSFVAIEGEEHVRAGLKKGRGVLIAVAHFGNWELAGAACALSGFDVSVVAFPQRNPLADRLINGIRSASGQRVLLTGEAAKPVLKALKANGVVGILADQDVAEHGVFVSLLGRPASTAHGPSILAHRARDAADRLPVSRRPGPPPPGLRAADPPVGGSRRRHAAGLGPPDARRPVSS